jgi:ATP-dependent Lon protease
MEEKLGIAEQHLVPRQIARHGLLPAQFTVTKEALQVRVRFQGRRALGCEWHVMIDQAIIREYTREAGVRNLEKHVAQLCRHVVTKVCAVFCRFRLESRFP